MTMMNPTNSVSSTTTAMTCWRILLVLTVVLQAATRVSSFSSHNRRRNALTVRMSTPDGPFWTPNADQVTDRLNQVNGNSQQQPQSQAPTAPQVSPSSTEGFRTQLNDFMKKVEDNKSYGGGTVNSSTMGKNGDINKNNNNNGMSTPLQNQFPPKSDEYDVVFPGESCFYFLETEKGETAFGGYKPLPNGEKSPAELCNLYVRV